MSQIVYLLPIALLLGLAGLVAFLWSLNNGQYDDMEGASMRILDDDDKPLPAEDEAKGDKPHVKKT